MKNPILGYSNYDGTYPTNVNILFIEDDRITIQYKNMQKRVFSKEEFDFYKNHLGDKYLKETKNKEFSQPTIAYALSPIKIIVGTPKVVLGNLTTKLTDEELPTKDWHTINNFIYELEN